MDSTVFKVGQSLVLDVDYDGIFFLWPDGDRPKHRPAWAIVRGNVLVAIDPWDDSDGSWPEEPVGHVLGEVSEAEREVARVHLHAAQGPPPRRLLEKYPDLGKLYPKEVR